MSRDAGIPPRGERERAEPRITRHIKIARRGAEKTAPLCIFGITMMPRTAFRPPPLADKGRAALF